MNFEQIFSENASANPLSISELSINLLIGAFLAFIVRQHFFRFSNSLTNRSEFMSVLPFIILTTTLIISIVKSSLALSLGLVGALSIVRFRTPIKEPEELAYLFISIGIGLGLGANQIITTIVATIIILLLMIFFMKNKKLNSSAGETYINLDGSIEYNIQKDLTESIFKKLSTLSKKVSLKRYIVNGNNVNLTFYITELNADTLDFFIMDMKKDYPNLCVTLLDQRNLPPF